MSDQTKTPEELAAEEAAKAAASQEGAETETEVVTDLEDGDGEGGDEIDYLSMSDEEIAKMDAPPASDVKPVKDEDDDGADADGSDGSDGDNANGADTDDGANKKVEGDAPKTPETPKQPEGKKEAVKKADDSGDSGDKPKAAANPLEVEDAVAVAAYKQIFAPFKANNKEVQVRTPEEAVRLMQMGAGHMRYKKRVEPMLTRAQTLENANIGDEELNFLIELKNKKPEAIKKLVRDAGLDPYDIATDDAAKAADKNYRPGDYSASSTQVTLRETLETTQSMQGGTELLNDLRTSWDDNSRQMALEDPAIISALAQQKEAGVYDQIAAEIDRRLILGQLANEPFLQLYHKVGLEMTENGMFTEATNTPGAQQKSQVVTTPKPKEVIETRTVPPAKSDKAAKAAAALAPVAAKPTGKVAPDAVLNMSDEEFEKLDGMERFV